MWYPGEASNLWQNLENTLSNHFKAAFNWCWGFHVALWIILRSANTKGNKHQHSLTWFPALHRNAKKHRGAEVSAESCWRRLRWRGHDFSNQMSTHASIAAEPLSPFHPHTQLTLAFEGPAGLSSGCRRSSAARWELWNTGLPFAFSRIHIVNFLFSVLFLKPMATIGSEADLGLTAL